MGRGHFVTDPKFPERGLLREYPLSPRRKERIKDAKRDKRQSKKDEVTMKKGKYGGIRRNKREHQQIRRMQMQKKRDNGKQIRKGKKQEKYA